MINLYLSNLTVYRPQFPTYVEPYVQECIIIICKIYEIVQQAFQTLRDAITEAVSHYKGRIWTPLKPNNVRDEAFWNSPPTESQGQAWEQMLAEGKKKFQADPSTQDMDIAKHYYLLSQMIKDLPVSSLGMVKLPCSVEFILFKNPENSTVLTEGVIYRSTHEECKNYGLSCDWIFEASAAKLERENQVYHKFFISFCILDHAILVAIEFNTDRMNISIIDPLGADNSYTPYINSFIEGLMTLYALYPDSRVIQNTVVQQHDLACGFHLLFNLCELINIPGSVYDYVDQKKLSPRSWKEMQEKLSHLA